MTGIRYGAVASWACGLRLPSRRHQWELWKLWSDCPWVHHAAEFEATMLRADFVCTQIEAKLGQVFEHERKRGALMTGPDIISHVLGSYLP